MSDAAGTEALGINDDAVLAQAAGRGLRWRRRSPGRQSDGGSVYGAMLCQLNSWRAAVALSRPDVNGEAAASVAELPEAALEIELRAALRNLRRDADNTASIERLALFIGEFARRAGVVKSHDRELRAAAAVMIKGKHAYLSGERRRREALVVAICGAALMNERIHVVFHTNEIAKTYFGAWSKLYTALNISRAHVDSSAPVDARRVSFLNQVVHVDAETLAADHLTDLEITRRDGHSLRASVNLLAQRELENRRIILHGASSLFIDEADHTLGTYSMRQVTLAGDTSFFEESQFAEEAIAFARLLQRNQDYTIENGTPWLTEAGRKRAEDASIQFSPLWSGESRREATLIHALAALYVWKNGEDYGTDNGKLEPLTDEMREAFMDSDVLPPMKMLLAAKEEKIEEKDRRVRRRMSVRSVLTGYSRISAISCPGAGVAGEFWVGLGTSTVDGSSLRRIRMIDAAAVAASNEEKIAAAARILTAEAIAGRDCALVAEKELGDAVIAKTHEACAERGAAGTFFRIGVEDAVEEKLGSLPQTTGVLIMSAYEEDELWRRLLDVIRLNAPTRWIGCVLGADDPLFHFAPEWTQAVQIQSIIQGSGFLSRIYIHSALAARRASFTSYRKAYMAHDKAINRVLAFMGGT